MTTVSKSTKILIDNFIGTYFANIPSENREQIKESVIDIADSLFEQNNIQNHINVDNLATKADLLNLREATQKDIANLREATQKDIANLREATQKDIVLLREETKKDIADLKYDLLKWLVTAQIAIAGLLLAMIKLI
ncbi:hypothetical protein [Helicobacter sp. T3_23-1059]